ncbi:hypothetical protein [Paenibacillus oleatilyticus]|uniref:hypothetical protein n=1 Tax=Paenibacillus oleatilyticus TaxID=2594886 RepID=UPI001C1FC7EE|nr:hypothetical protein [Paenibacillus oleatilyticus]MBU7318216.1 hypothetical protein [Paenibacillus oleatilyticus]
MESNKLLENLTYFKQFITKTGVREKLSYLKIFPEFEAFYTQIKIESSEERPAWVTTCLTLVKGIEENLLSKQNIDEILFRLIEDNLLNSFLYKIDSHNISLHDIDAAPAILKAWGAPSENELLNNVVSQESSMKYKICGFRISTDRTNIRLLLLDEGYVKHQPKNQDASHVVYPTLIEFDFEKNLTHIRIKDIENISSDIEEVRTVKGRVSNLLEFISKLSPSIKLSEFTNFRESLFLIEESLLVEKRDQAEQLVKNFNNNIQDFTELVIKTFNPPASQDVLSPIEYISSAVLSIVSTTIKNSELGDIVGIRFRNHRDDSDYKYAEIHIVDRDFKCISSNELYWINLPVLKSERKVEHLKIGKSFESGFAIFTLDFSLDTANIRLLKRSSHPDEEIQRQPSDQKYLDVVEFIYPFMKLKK